MAVDPNITTNYERDVKYSVGDLYVYIQNTLNKEIFFLEVNQYKLQIKGEVYSHITMEMSFRTRKSKLIEKIKEVNTLFSSGASYYSFYVRAYLKNERNGEKVIFSGNLKRLVSVSDNELNYSMTAISDSHRLDKEPMYIDYGMENNVMELIKDNMKRYNECIESTNLEQDSGIKTNTEFFMVKTDIIENEDYYKNDQYKIKDPLIQYKETFWNFFTRIAKITGIPIYQSGQFLNIGVTYKDENNYYTVNLQNSISIAIDGETGRVVNREVYRLGDFLGMEDKKEAKLYIGFVSELIINMKSQAGIECEYLIKDINQIKPEAATYNNNLETLMGKLTKVHSMEKMNPEANEIIKRDQSTMSKIDRQNLEIDQKIKTEEIKKEKAETEEEKTECDKKIETFNMQKEKNIQRRASIEKDIEELKTAYKEVYATGEVDFGEFFQKRGIFDKEIKKLGELDGNYKENIKRTSFYFITDYQNSMGKRDFSSMPVSGENVLVKFIDSKENSGTIIGATQNKNDNTFLSDNMNINAGKAVLEVKEDLHVEKR